MTYNCQLHINSPPLRWHPTSQFCPRFSGIRLAMWEQWSYIWGMNKTAMIRARIEPGLKSEVEAILAELGLTASEAVHLLYRQIRFQRGLPFDLRVPNALTARTLNASKAGKNVKRFATKKELFSDLGV